ncbi:MAG: YihY family inner membrane protein [Janthinobacterium lividum]
MPEFTEPLSNKLKGTAQPRLDPQAGPARVQRARRAPARVRLRAAVPKTMRALSSGLSWDQARDLLKFAARRVAEERLPQVAGSLTYTSVLALVPVLTIALAIFTAFPLFDSFRTALEAYFLRNLMPPNIANTILGYLTQFSTKATRLSAFGAVFLIITAISMIGMVDRTFNRIWRVRSPRPLVQRVIMYWTVITLGPLLLGFSFSVTAYLLTATNGLVGASAMVGSVFYTLVSTLLTWGAFTLLYVVVPNRVIAWPDAAWGGAVAAVAFEISKRLFAIFITNFHTYTMVYGAVAAIPIFLVWIYVGWFITLVGALLSAALPIVKHERWWHVGAPGSEFVDAVRLLQVLYAARTRDAQSVVAAAAMRQATQLGYDEAEDMLQKMLDLGWVGRIKPEVVPRLQFGKRVVEGVDGWTMVVNPRELRLADVYRLFVFQATEDEGLAQRVEAAVEHGLNMTLTDYFEERLNRRQADLELAVPH